MSISVSDELQLFAQEIQSLLSPNTLQNLARDTGFVQRTSKYRAQDLIALCVWISQSVAKTSLTQLCSCLEASTEVLISPEGLNQRFNAVAVQFLQQVLAKLLNRKLSSSRLFSSPYTSIFKSIRILDSTAFQLPDVFSSVYPGAGGCSHKAGIKIQLEYDLLSGQLKKSYLPLEEKEAYKYLGLFQNTRFAAIRTHFTYENGNLIMEGGTTGKQVLKMIHPLLFEDSEGNKVSFKKNSAGEITYFHYNSPKSLDFVAHAQKINNKPPFDDVPQKNNYRSHIDNLHALNIMGAKTGNLSIRWTP
ncbi:hypothetical protein IIC_04757 [Bacillus cereus VD021]|uniref:IS4 family transposase n=1 Tax=Bacillus cereus VD021 TaxID=1053224 RepID=R8HBS2_BACCE|nr:hypothetical protein IIC_04757 [Bacillus cereus VD021]